MLRVVMLTILFFIIVYILGRSLLIRIRAQVSFTNIILMGVLLYFSLFELIAFPMTLLFKSLTEQSYIWAVFIVLICINCMLNKKFWRNTQEYPGISYLGKSSCINNKEIIVLFSIVIVLFVIQTFVMVNHSAGSMWDVAYYFGQVNTSIYTDTLYIYDGTTGEKLDYLPIRYAISSFWTHDAVLAKLFSVHGTIVCRYFNALTLSLLSVLVVYELAKQFFDKKVDWYKAVIFWILANWGITTIYYQNYFLLFRAMENKSYCCNFIIPVTLLLILKIWNESDKKQNWICLFIASVSGVAISGTAMILVPILEGCCLGAHWLTVRKSEELRRIIICLLPCIVYAIIYIFMQVKVVN